jgi:hypothetical protein
MVTYVFAEQQLATAAVEALIAEFTVVRGDSITYLETLDILRCVSKRSLQYFCVLNVLTLPTAAMRPTVSWPGMRGNLAMNSPSWIC